MLDFPVAENLKVLAGKTLSKSGGWWKAAVLVEERGRLQVRLYLWQNKDGEWKARHRFAIKNGEDWTQLKAVIDELFAEATLLTTPTQGDWKLQAFHAFVRELYSQGKVDGLPPTDILKVGIKHLYERGNYEAVRSLAERLPQIIDVDIEIKALVQGAKAQES